uniref:XK-related protein n=1 Tax=Clastoptera arizonana TaxID=38151 RepID=A0A1B6CVP3_9HEMI
MAQYEFLPLCDVLFNIISLASYFCDIVFDVVMGYALFERDRLLWFVVTISFVLLSLIVCQIVSLRWYLHALEAHERNKEKEIEHSEKKPFSTIKKLSKWSVIFLHSIQFGVLWRYFKLFIPVDLRFVKYEVRDLCMLRLLHAFCEAAPMLLVQLYLLWHETATKEFRDLNLVSMILSLFSVCWALASFSKNVRMQNVHRLVLTWLGVIFQFLWRLGTVCARVISLTAYATLYGRWVFLVIVLHWVSMFLWLVSPKNVFHGERISRRRKAAFSALIAFVYVFAYVNLQEVNHRQKMLTFYVVMGLENALLLVAWRIGVSRNPPWYSEDLPLLVGLLFGVGLVFQALYYRYFHVRRLNYEAGGRLNSNNSTARLQPSRKETSNGTKELVRRHSFSGVYNSNGIGIGVTTDIRLIQETEQPTQQPIKYRYHCTAHHHGGIPGVFNCRFTNPYTAAMTKRKKKKPTSFVPPPSVGDSHNGMPFWCRPLPTRHSHQGGSSENEGSSVGSRVNIQQKLQEKKQKQLAELRVIEEEIKQGKLHPSPASAGPEPPPPPPPRGKQPPQPRANTPEILLAPHYLDSFEWGSSEADPIYRLCQEDNDSNQQMLLLMYKTYRVSSDLDSQVSLPRSYTLPRQFKYYRRARARKAIRSEHFVASTNSSDGDVDSADDNESESSHTVSQPRPIRITQPLYRVKHETKL